MKKNLPLIAILFFLFAFGLRLNAQSPPSLTKFGEIDAKQLNMTVYEQDTSAAAVVLHDIGQSYFRFRAGGIKLIFDRHVRIKVLKKSGYDQADVSIPYYKAHSTNKEVIINLKGATYNLVGAKVQVDKLGKESIFDEKTTDNGLNQRKFTFPNVKEGSVIEYAYTIESDFFTHFRDWDFQTEIPTLWSEYMAKIPDFFDYKQFARGYEPFVINSRKLSNDNLGGGPPARVTEYRWAMMHVPALKEEPYITTLSDYRAQIEFELALISIPGYIHQPYMHTWDKITKELLESETFGGQLGKTGFVKNEIAALSKEHSDPEQRMNAIHKYVANQIKWNEKSRLALESNTNTKKAFDNRTGSSADINLLLVAMLREAKLDANPVILSTRSHGRVETSLPMITRFNYVIAHVAIGDKEYLMDATEPLAPVNMLPVRCLNGQGRLISGQNSRWVNLEAKQKYSDFYNAKFTLDKEGNLKGTILNAKNGYNALPVRRTIFVEGQQKYVENFKKQSSGWEVSKINIKNQDNLNDALELDYEVTMDGQASGDLIYLNPMLNRGEKENAFKLENRKFPVDFAAQHEETYLCSFTLPEGYKVEEQPKNALVLLPEGAGRFAYSINVLGNTIQVMSQVSLKKPVFMAEEYPHLKEFYNHIVAKHAEQIVLKKISN
jgi:hypothetical protein